MKLNKNQVWVVHEGCLVYGVFTDKKKADKLIVKLHKKNKYLPFHLNTLEEYGYTCFERGVQNE